MKKRFLALIALASLGAVPAAQAAGNIDCKLHYSLAGWSVFYKTASGSGTITCDNGARIPVKISVKGGGLSVGKSTVTNGKGNFTGAYPLNDLIGSYASVEAHAGADKSGSAQVVTKGDVSLALAGTGKGWDLGIAGARFTIERR